MLAPEWEDDTDMCEPIFAEKNVKTNDPSVLAYSPVIKIEHQLHDFVTNILPMKIAAFLFSFVLTRVLL